MGNINSLTNITTNQIKSSNAAQAYPASVRVFAQGIGSYSTDDKVFTNPYNVGEEYGFGSPLHIIAKRLESIMASSIEVVISPIAEPAGATESTGTLSLTGTQLSSKSYNLLVNNVAYGSFVIAKGDTAEQAAAKINDYIASANSPIESSVSTADLTFTSKWKGETANQIVVEFEGSFDGIDLTTPSLTGGAGNLDYTNALAKIGNDRVSGIITQESTSDVLDVLDAFNETRYAKNITKPFVAYHGNVDADRTTATALTKDRNLDRTNSVTNILGSKYFTFDIAASVCEMSTRLLDSNVTKSHADQILIGLEKENIIYPDAAEREQFAQEGMVAAFEQSGKIQIAELITPYFKAEFGDNQIYRFVVDIHKMFTVYYNFRLTYEAEEMKGRAIVADGAAVSNINAIKLKTIKGITKGILEGLASEGVIYDINTIEVDVSLNESNNSQVDQIVSFDLSKNLRVNNITLNVRS